MFVVAHNFVVALLNTHLSAQKLGTALYNCVGFMKTYFLVRKRMGSGPLGAFITKNRGLNR